MFFWLAIKVKWCLKKSSKKYLYCIQYAQKGEQRKRTKNNLDLTLTTTNLQTLFCNWLMVYVQLNFFIKLVVKKMTYHHLYHRPLPLPATEKDDPQQIWSKRKVTSHSPSPQAFQPSHLRPFQLRSLKILIHCWTSSSHLPSSYQSNHSKWVFGYWLRIFYYGAMCCMKGSSCNLGIVL